MCVKFSLNGEKIYCGYKNEIKIFATPVPGRDCINIDTKRKLLLYRMRPGFCNLIICDL